MRGKKPSEREKYVLPAGGGAFVEVTREVYLEWHQSRRRERYQAEKKQAHGVCSLEALGENALYVLPVAIGKILWKKMSQSSSALSHRYCPGLRVQPEKHTETPGQDSGAAS